MQNQPGPQDCHGCPYRHFGPERLQTALLAAYGAQGLGGADVLAEGEDGEADDDDALDEGGDGVGDGGGAGELGWGGGMSVGGM